MKTLLPCLSVRPGDETQGFYRARASQGLVMVNEIITITSKTKQRGKHLWEKKIAQNYCSQNCPIFSVHHYTQQQSCYKKKVLGQFNGSGNKIKKQKNNTLQLLLPKQAQCCMHFIHMTFCKMLTEREQRQSEAAPNPLWGADTFF